MRFLLLIILCVSLVPNLLGQQETSSYEKRARSATDYTAEAESMAQSNPSRALELIEKALEASYRTGNLNVEAKAQHTRGNIHLYQGNHLLAMEAFDKALVLYDRLNLQSDYHASFLGKAKAQEGAGQYAQALKSYQAILTKAQLASDQALIQESLQAITRIQANTGQVQSAEDSYEQLLFNSPTSIDSVNSIANVGYARSSDNAVVKKVSKQKVQLRGNTSQQQLEQIAQANIYVGDNLLKEQKADEAIEHYNYNTKILEKEDFSGLGEVSEESLEEEEIKPEELTFTWTGPEVNDTAVDVTFFDRNGTFTSEANNGTKAEIPEKLTGNSASTTLYYTKTKPIPKLDSLVELRSTTYRKLAEAYEIQGNYELAWRNGKKALEEADSARSQELNFVLNNAFNREALALRESRILSLEQDRKLQAQELRSQRLLNTGLAAALLAIIAGGLFAWWSQRKRQRANQLLTLRSLVGQMNPHFIFNSLNTFNSYIATADTQQANRFLSDFSRLMRLVLEYSGHDFVPLPKEIEVLKLYLKLEHGRFSENFDYYIEVAEDLDLDAIEIPPMLLQPYAENAIWHGLRYKKTKGQLLIKMYSEGQKLKVLIQDDGIGRSKSAALKTHNQQQKSNSLGMKNTARRADLISTLFKKSMQIHVNDLYPEKEETGTAVLVEIDMSKISVSE
ncbi:MAG: histidine kinase [Bacteroidia bacterium]